MIGNVLIPLEVMVEAGVFLTFAFVLGFVIVLILITVFAHLISFWIYLYNKSLDWRSKLREKGGKA